MDSRYSCLRSDRRTQSEKIDIISRKCVRHDARILTPNIGDNISNHLMFKTNSFIWVNLILSE